jgi:hypothetical protein
MSKDKISTVTYKGYKINVHPDYDCESPREWDKISKMVCFHRRYTLGDAHEYGRAASYGSWDAIEKEIRKREDVVWLQDVYMIDHGGLALSLSPFSCPWDSGQIGFIYVTKQSVREAYGRKYATKKLIAKAIESAKAELKIYDDYVRGYCYGFTITGHGDAVMDSCWGLIGDYEKDLMDGAKSMVDWMVKEDAEKTANIVSKLVDEGYDAYREDDGGIKVRHNHFDQYVKTIAPGEEALRGYTYESAVYTRTGALIIQAVSDGGDAYDDLMLRVQEAAQLDEYVSGLVKDGLNEDSE